MKKLFLLGVCVVLFSSIAFAKDGKDLFKMGGDLVIQRGETVENATTIKGNIVVKGNAKGNVTAIGGNVTIDPKAEIKGNAVAIKGKVKLGNGAKVFGNISEINPGKAIPMAACGMFGMFWLFRLLSFLGIIAVAVLFVALFPEFVEDVAEVIEENLGYSVLWGVLGTMAIIPLAFILAISLVGILLIPFELLFVFLAIIAGYFIVASLAGEKILDSLKISKGSLIIKTILGLLILAIIGLVPFLGFIIKAAVVVVGFGGMLMVLYSKLFKKKGLFG